MVRQSVLRWRAALVRLRRLPGFVMVAAGVTAAGCAGGAPVVTAEGPTVVCGTVLKGTVAFYMVSGRMPVIRHAGRSWLYFMVARGCARGSRVRWVPRSAARLVRTVRTQDGLAKAVELAPDRVPSSFRLTVFHDGKLAGSVTVRLSP